MSEMKCSHDDLTSPNPKCHNTEQSNIPHPSSSKHLNLWCLKLLPTLVNHPDESERLDDIYSTVQMALRPIKREQRASFVDKAVFKTNVSLDKQAFNEVVRRAAEEGASEEDLRAVVAHEVFWTELSPPRHCPRNLPVELLLRIICTVVSNKDLCNLRSVNSTFNKLATRVIFGNTTVSNNYKSADRLWTVLHTPHIAQCVQSLTYIEDRDERSLGPQSSPETS
ncbi:hypothetical protein BC826DRAFT_106996 [Russula brevipes]|nr:hypothetical protein BC826DRAFT_106996 [Russula brevipes]